MKSGNTPQSLVQAWQFGVEINGFDTALFRKGQEPKTEFDESSFAPGGSMFDQKLPGRAKFADITLEKGQLQAGADSAALAWVQTQVDVINVTGGLPSSFLRDVDIVRYDRTGKEIRRWTLHGAWVKSLEFDDIEGGKSDPSIEKITLAYQYWTRA